eukprot:Sspe_Gene.14899::Locus_5170_Transcript_1_1_Confidence_1.000_Length_2817::g.14899::m.14899
MARVEVPASFSVQDDVEFFKGLGFRLSTIFPSDDPQRAVVEGHGMHLELVRGSDAPPPRVILSGETSHTVVSPGGCTVRFEGEKKPTAWTLRSGGVEVRTMAEAKWTVGRAGMLYRDLVPSRLGGGLVASHIRIEKGGEVPDSVHFHDIAFQLIFCYKGWVRLVYEDQGPPFVLRSGDCVTQPPRIRHRVLESSDMLEVVEVGVPVEHRTVLDWDMELPTPILRRDRTWDGQRFCHHKRDEAIWDSSARCDFERCDTGVRESSAGAASVQVLRRKGEGGGSIGASPDTRFCFVLSGAATFEDTRLEPGSAVTLPPGEYYLRDPEDSFELLEVALPEAPAATLPQSP